MKFNLKLVLLISLLLIIGNFFVFNSLKAINAPFVTFYRGDDILQDGGTNDAFDSFIRFDITSLESNITGYEVQYSVDGGNNWLDVDAYYYNPSVSFRAYYWSTSKIYAPTLLFRTRSVHDGPAYSEYYTATLNLSHRTNNPLAYYHLEDFTTSDDLASSSNINWDVNRASLELADGFSTGYAISNDVLSAVSNSYITQIAFQPVQSAYQIQHNVNIEYSFSNNGTDWEGPYSFPTDVVPDPQLVIFSSIDNKLYWRVDLTDNSPSSKPFVFQLRIDWQENYTPQACFNVSPLNTFDPDQIFTFSAACTSDYEDTSNLLDYRWDFDGNGTFEVDWTTGISGMTQTYSYGATTTQTIVLEARDTFDDVDDYTTQVNTGEEPVGVYGWLWSSNYGWISLNCDNIYYGTWANLCSYDYGITRNGNELSGWTWSPNIGWLCFGQTCLDYYGSSTPPFGSVPVIHDSQNGEVQGWGNFIVYGQNNGWLSLNDQGTLHEVILDGSGSMSGFGWNGFDSNNNGVGWVQFLGNLSFHWLETKYGSIYGVNDIGSSDSFSSPGNRYNATYCIRSGGTVNTFSSESGCLETSYTDLGFPSLSNQYWSIPGLINFNRLANSYEQVNFASTDVDGSLSPTYITLSNKVYNFTGQSTYTIDNPITFYNARGINSSGAGTIIINGDLNIDSDLYYEEAGVASQIENLASVTWIVKGDLIVSPSVSNLVGNFIVLGNGSSNGEFHTGNDTGIERQLIIKGLVIAHEFFLERTYLIDNEPAEKIIYDGRVIVNTPPGMDNVAGGLPIWREAMASTVAE